MCFERRSNIFHSGIGASDMSVIITWMNHSVINSGWLIKINQKFTLKLACIFCQLPILIVKKTQVSLLMQEYVSSKNPFYLLVNHPKSLSIISVLCMAGILLTICTQTENCQSLGDFSQKPRELKIEHVNLTTERLKRLKRLLADWNT